MKYFDLEEERVKQEVLRLNAKRVLIQLPQGLKDAGLKIARIVRRLGALPIVSADPCYGACDIAVDDAENLNVDLLIHYGHARLLKHEKVPTLYIEARATLDVGETIEKALPLIKNWSKIGLATTVQHVQAIDEIKEMLIRAGKTVVVGDAGRLSYPGQITGCDYSNAKSIAKDVDVFLFVGGGRFHALGLAISVQKPIVVADPYERRAYAIENMEVQRILNKRWASIQEAAKAKTFAVIVGLKHGQKRINEALDISGKLEKAGKEVFLFALRELTPEALLEFPSIEAYVNTACPRISLDDASRFSKPVISLNEARVVVGELTWEGLCKKGWFED